ncbi:NAD(P)-binding protein [Sphingomonas changnyeongensis]|uniref:NAD(P)-binding protein n=1 Tax=Sphingomonas changnyeongensis TaxID=2698679 RepID=A0A7Z2S8B1_9SPHN|nr:FAD-dependent oxidoreductase [Sphingomonas changnyeongensis]QHL89624.1 NAD(P)-binding protein [Sphingomonas changnyeongensis]
MQIVIVGAGLAGLAAADALMAAGHRVRLIDKARGPGGRMSTRRAETPLGAVQFDHGAQYFTARTPDFVAQVDAWAAAGIVAPWPAAGPDAFVGVPGMNAPVRALAAGHDVMWSTRAEALVRAGAGWRVTGDAGGAALDIAADAVLVAVPAEQQAALLAPHDPAFAARAQASRSAPCWTVMAAFAEPVAAPDSWRGGTDGDGGVIGWAARNSAKPGRAGPEAFVIQASPDWSRAHLEDDADTVAAALLAVFGAVIGTALPVPAYVTAHRWRYAMAARLAEPGPPALWNPALRLGACGDWLVGPRVESGFVSGRALAALIGGDHG